MRNFLARSGNTLMIVLLAAALGGCGGAKVLKEPLPLQINQSLVSASDERVSLALDWVIVRDGPGTWARNADWDEYILRVTNHSADSVTINRMTVVDSLGTRIVPQTERRLLIKHSRKTARRYNKSGLKVKAGAGMGTMIVAGTAVTAVGVGAASAVVASGLGGGFGTGVGAAAGGTAAVGALLVLGPALAVGGIIRGVNNNKVGKMIEERQTALPKTLAVGDQATLRIFFPIAPSPVNVEIEYSSAEGDHFVVLVTQEALEGLHIKDVE